jgi:hypothetical protein
VTTVLIKYLHQYCFDFDACLFSLFALGIPTKWGLLHPNQTGIEKASSILQLHNLYFLNISINILPIPMRFFSRSPCQQSEQNGILYIHVKQELRKFCVCYILSLMTLVGFCLCQDSTSWSTTMMFFKTLLLLSVSALTLLSSNTFTAPMLASGQLWTSDLVQQSMWLLLGAFLHFFCSFLMDILNSSPHAISRTSSGLCSHQDRYVIMALMHCSSPSPFGRFFCSFFALFLLFSE